MKTLGEILRGKGWISNEQLVRALERHQQLGGRLGTCLLEAGAIGQELLLEALAEQLGVPTASQADLEEIEPETLALLPASLALEKQAIAFRSARGRADVAMLDVGDLALEDELSFAIGRRVTFHITTELILFQALAKHYDVELPGRFASLALQLSRGERRREADKPRPTVSTIPPSLRAGATPAARPTPIRRQTRAVGWEEPRVITLTAQEKAALAAVKTGPTAQLAAHSAVAESAEDLFAERLAEAETSSAIGKALLQVLGEQFVRVILFRVSGSRQEARGWLAAGPEIDSEWLQDYSVGLHQATAFRQLLTSRTLFIGRLEEHPGHVALARCWGGSLEHECMMLPIFVRGHLTCVVYGDRDSLGIAGVDLVLTQRLAAKAAIAFERCILRHKLQAD